MPFLTRLLQILLLYLFLVAVDIWFWGITFSPSADLANSMISGSIFNMAYWQFYLKDLYGFGYLANKLYVLLPMAPWVPMLFLALLFIPFLIGGQLLLQVSEKYALNRWQMLALFLLAVSIYNINILVLDHNRVALLMSAALIVISLIDLYDSFKKTSIFFTALIALLASCIRIEAVWGVFLLVIPAGLFFKSPAMWRALRKLSIAIVVIGIYSACLVYNLMYSEDYYYQLEPDFEYELMDKGNIVSLSAMSTKADSLKYEAIAKFWFFADVANIPPSYIRGLIDKDKSHRFSLINFKGTYVKSTYTKAKSLALQPIFITFIFVISLLAVSFNRIKDAVKVFVWACYIFFVLLFVVGSINQEIEPRLSEPILTASMALIFAFCVKHIEGFRMTVTQRAYVSFSLISSFVANSLTVQSNKADWILDEANRKLIQCVNTQASIKNIVLFTDGLLYHSHDRVFTYGPVFPSKKIIPLNMAQYSHSAQFLGIIHKQTGCPDSSLDCIINFVIEQKENSIIISNNERVDFLKNYLQYFFNMNLRFIPADINCNHPSLKLYYVEGGNN